MSKQRTVAKQPPNKNNNKMTDKQDLNNDIIDNVVEQTEKEPIVNVSTNKKQQIKKQPAKSAPIKKKDSVKKNQPKKKASAKKNKPVKNIPLENKNPENINEVSCETSNETSSKSSNDTSSEKSPKDKLKDKQNELAQIAKGKQPISDNKLTQQIVNTQNKKITQQIVNTQNTKRKEAKKCAGANDKEICSGKIVYNFRGNIQQDNYRCGKHKIEAKDTDNGIGMLDLSRAFCQTDGCNRYAKFGEPNTKKLIMCGTHKDKLVDVANKKCVTCGKRAHFKVEGKEGMFCSKHSEGKGISKANKLCIKCGEKQPIFNVVGETKPLYCKDCKTGDMVDVKNDMCRKCNIIRPNFNFTGETKPLYCETCKDIIDSSMVDVTHIKCHKVNCTTRALYNYPNESKPLYCSKHGSEIEGMSNILSNLCDHEGCKKVASFNKPGNKKGKWCEPHKGDDDVDVTHVKCAKNGCNIQANYGEPNGIKKTHCSKHKGGNFINHYAKICNAGGCNKEGNYALPNDINVRFCREHADDDLMIDVKHKNCAGSNCGTRPSFGIKGGPITHCGQCKPLGMINLNQPKCLIDECDERANYCVPTEIAPIFCGIHSDVGLVHVSNKKCQYPDCKDKAIYGLPNKRAQYCETHYIHDHMINISEEMRCDVFECNKDYVIIVNDIKYCFSHCPEGEYKHSINKICKYCDITSKSQFVCADCKKKSNKTEWGVVQYIKQNIDSKLIYNSSRMFEGLTNKRPDLFIELNKHCIIIEIDENQHKPYKCECSRVAEIAGSIGALKNKSIVLIRFNPDKIKHKKRNINIDIETRLIKLVEVIKREMDYIYTGNFNVEIITMYYDNEYDDDYQDIKRQDITTDITVNFK